MAPPPGRSAPRPRPGPGHGPVHLGRRPLGPGRLLHPHPQLPPRRPRPARPPRRPLHFAGEHTAGPWSGLMEGGLRSGHRAAAELLATRPGTS
ncbi:MAG: FAD-dependent oxidoreductase [Actinomycetes bacterium]